MIVVLNGPLGIGKSTLAEALQESIDQCVMLDGDSLVAANPPHPKELDHLHTGLALMIGHHRRSGYRHFVINHIWRSPEELEDLRRRLLEADPDAKIRCFLLTLSLEENLRRIRSRHGTRAIDESAFERRTVLEEREALYADSGDQLGERFDASGAPRDLVQQLLSLLRDAL